MIWVSRMILTRKKMRYERVNGFESDDDDDNLAFV
jgi:hypothetical protein